MNPTLLADIGNNSWTQILLVGVVAGAILGAILRGKGFGYIGNVLVGIVGAVLGTFIYEKLLSKFVSFDLGNLVLDLNLVVIALIGAFLFLLIVRFIKSRD